jgi:hypothetical protein
VIESVLGSWGLVALFGVHLVVFAALAVRKRTWQYLPAILTFALLVTLNGLRALQVGGEELYLTLRVLAFVGLGVSVLAWWRRRAAQSSASS